MSIEENVDFEKSHWDGRRQSFGLSNGPHYILDTVLYHEKDTDALYKAQKALELAKDKKVLEVGANGCGFSFLMAKVAKEVWGLDLLEEPLNYARKFKDLINKGDFSKESWGEEWCKEHTPDWKVDNVFFIQGNAYNLETVFAPAIFDVVFMYACIEHFPVKKRGKSVRDAAYVLKEGGKLILQTVMDVDSEDREEWMAQMLRDVHPFGLPTMEQLVSWMEKVGLKITEKNDMWFGADRKYRIAFLIGEK